MKKRLLLLLALLLPVFLLLPGAKADEERPEMVELTRLLALRLALVREVAWSKANAGIPVADPAREAALLTALKQEGKNYSLTSDQVSTLFLPQIVASRRYQEELLASWRAGMARPKTKPLDLRADLRPRIDHLDADLLRNWAAFPHDQLDAWSFDAAVKMLRERGIPAEVARIAARPLGSP